jgi:hypothetical protein
MPNPILSGIYKIHKGTKRSAEVIEKFRLLHLGKYPSDETRRKMSDSKKIAKISPPTRTGIPHTAETKLKMSNSHRKILKEITDVDN